MGRFLVRRALLMVPTFLGIAAVTFAVAGLVGDPLAAGVHDPDALPRRALSPEEAARLRESLGLDRPAFLNRDVEDRRRWVERDAETIMEDAASVPSDPAVAPALARLARHGAMAAVHLAPFLERRSGDDPEAVRRILDAVSRGIGEPVADPADLVALARRAEPGGPWHEDAIAAATARLFGAGATAPGDLAERLAGVTALGGLAVPGVARGVLDAREPGPAAVAALRWLASVSGFDGRVPEGFDGARPPTPAEAEDLTRVRARLARWWDRNRLKYTAIGGLERWAFRSWSETRFSRWIRGILAGDFGESLVHRRPVAELLAESLPPTLMIQGAAILVMLLAAIPLGVWSAVHRGSPLERAVAGLLFLLYAAPEFWLGALAILHLNGVLPIDGLRSAEIAAALRDGSVSAWSPAAVADLLRHLLLPAGILALGGIAVVARYARVGLLEVLRQDFVRTARAKGLPPRAVVWRHAFRIGAVPLATLLGALLPMLVGGSVVVERMFNVPGMGLLAWNAALASDVPVAMAVMTLTALLTMAGYVLADLAAAWLDPRTRLR